jgi:Ca-activated chloride channel family protein
LPEADPPPGLADLARLTQGQYFSIASADDAARVIRAIDTLEPTLARPALQRQVREWYWAALALAAALLVWARWLVFRRSA